MNLSEISYAFPELEPFGDAYWTTSLWGEEGGFSTRRRESRNVAYPQLGLAKRMALRLQLLEAREALRRWLPSAPR